MFYTQNLVHRVAFAQESFYTKTFFKTQKNFDTEKLVHTDCATKIAHT